MLHILINWDAFETFAEVSLLQNLDPDEIVMLSEAKNLVFSRE
jgi:hypothetical protein